MITKHRDRLIISQFLLSETSNQLRYTAVCLPRVGLHQNCDNQVGEDVAKLPNAENAVVPLSKLNGYALNFSHPEGQHKARKFKAILGLTTDDAVFLRNFLLEVVYTEEAMEGHKDAYGQRYSVDAELHTDQGSAIIRSAWIIRTGEDFPRLTSVYIP